MDVVEYVTTSEKLLVSPIWDQERTFHFQCMGHLEISKALGFELHKISPYLTIVKEGQMRTPSQLNTLVMESKINTQYFSREIEQISFLKENCFRRGCLCGGGCFGPLTVVSGILGAENMLKSIKKNPDFVSDFVAYVTTHLIKLAKEEIAEGADFFWIAEPLASLLSPTNFWIFSGQYLQKIYSEINVSGFLHVCGKTLKHTANMIHTGAKVLSIDSCTDIGECIHMAGNDIVIMGNVNPSTLKFGTEEDVKKEIETIFNACQGANNFVLSTGCSIMEGTPRRNMQIMFDMAQQYK